VRKQPQKPDKTKVYLGDPAVFAHVLCDLTERVETLEKHFDIKLPTFWDRRIASTKKNDPRPELLRWLRKMRRETGGPRG
jgi:hypothetical protein